MIKVSRILKQNGYKLSMAREKLSNKLGREATLEELSRETQLEIEDIVMATEANGDQVADDAESEIAAEGMINHLMIEQAMSGLDSKQRKLINMRYFQDKTQSEVARELGISQVQVSRLEKKLLEKMRETLNV